MNRRKRMRLFCAIVLIFNFITVTPIIYLMIALYDNYRSFGSIYDIYRKENFDSIAAANAIGRLDIVSMVLAFLGIIVAIVALGGFWLVRREAKEAAAEVAREVAPAIVRDYMTKIGAESAFEKGIPSGQIT
jgi:uncharacterized protein YneF (UPF0154 family)